MPKEYDENSMREEGYHAERLRDASTPIDFLGDNVDLLFESRGFRVYLNRKDNEIYIQVCDYHAGSLVITEQGLETLVRDLKSGNRPDNP